jgi:hypothetical protein
MSWMNLLGNAALGYGADRLMGGKGGVGAALGGLAGGTGYGLNLSGMMNGGNFMQEGLSGVVDSASGLLGGTGKQANGINMSYAPTGDMVKDMAIRQVPDATNLTNNSILGGISDFGTKYKDTIGAGIDLGNAYGKYQSDMANRDNTKAQMNYIQSLQRQQESENEYQRNARASTQTGLNTGFSNSVYGKPSNYYSA